MKTGDVHFEDISLFKGMPPTALDKIVAIFDIRSLEAGENLIIEGEEGNEMFILVRGRVRVSKAMLMEGMDLPLMETANLRKVLATVDETSYPIFGEIALIDHDTRSATIQALEPSDFLVTDRTRFFDLLDRDPSIGNRLFMALARRMAATIRNSNSELVKLSTALALALSKCGTTP